MRVLKKEQVLCYYDELSWMPLGVCQVRLEDGLRWVMFMLVGRTSPKGTGSRLLRLALRQHKDVWLFTRWANAAMFHCALNARMKLAGTDKDGFIFRHES